MSIAHAGRGGDQLQAEFAFQPLLDNFHVQQAEKSAAETEAERGGTFRLKEERRVVEPQFFQRFAQCGVLMRVHGVEAGKDHGLEFFKAGKRLNGGTRIVGNGVADLGVGHVFVVGDNEADFARDQARQSPPAWE